MKALSFELVNLPLFIVCVVAILWGLFLYYRYVRENKKTPFVLRIITFILVLIICLHPTLLIFKKFDKKPALAIIVDDSASMQIKDPLIRFELIRKLFKSDRLVKLQEKYKLNWYTFSSKVEKSSMENIIRKFPKGEMTDIGLAIQKVTDELSNENLSAMVVITDGAHNGNYEPVQVAQRCPVPIYTIGVGNPEKYCDLELMQEHIPDFIFKNTEAAISVKVKSYNFRSEKLPVFLRIGKEVLQSKKINIKEGEEVNVDFKLKSSNIGNWTYNISIPNYPQEITHLNNRKEFAINVLRDKIRMLYICGQPGYEYKFLRASLKSDPNIEVVSFVILRNPENISLFPETDLTLIPFPAQDLLLKDIYDFDIFVMENFSYNRFFSVQLLENVRNFVVEKGGAFVMLGGVNSYGKGGYKGTAIEDILPVEFAGNQEEMFNKDFKLKPVEFNHPIMMLGDIPEESRQIWESMPELSTCNQLLKPKNGSILLGVNNLSPDMPVLTVWQKGKGRVLAFASNSTWKWKTGLAMSGKGTYYYDVFWQSVIRWLINAPYLKPVKINLTKQNFTTGEDVRIRIHVFDKYYKPISGADIKLDIKTPDKKKINVDDISEVTAGEYETKVNFTEEGDYTLTAKAQKGNSILGTDSVHFKINLPNFEYTQANLNEELLKSISDETGGKYLHISNADKFEITYKSNIPEDISKSKLPIWNLFPLFAIVVFLLSLEWYIRRINNLP